MPSTSISLRGIGVVFLLLLWGLGGQARGQSSGDVSTASIAVQDAALGHALEQAAAAAGIRLAYDYALVDGRRASCTVRDATPEALLRCLLDGHPIDYVQTSGGTYVLQKAVRRPPQYGQLAGVVRSSNQGRPLPGAHVRLPEAETKRGTVADSTGQFRVTGLLPGPHTLVVTHLGYEPHKATVYVPPNATAHHDVTLATSPIVADSVTVNADRYEAGSAHSGDGNVTAAQLLRADANGTPDVLEAASTLLGVTTSAPYTDLHIQGGDAGGHTLYLDGVPVRNPASAGRLLGAFSPLALDGLRARKAGFGVLRGNALSGTIELKHDLSSRSPGGPASSSRSLRSASPRSEPRSDATSAPKGASALRSGRGSQYGTVRLDSRSLNARLQGTTTIGTTPVTAMVAGRLSVWDVYQDAALHDLIDRWSTLDPMLAAAQVPSDTSLGGGIQWARAQPNANFYDLHGAARFELGPAKRLYVSAYRGGSRLGADLVLGRGGGNQLNYQASAAEASADTSAFELPTRDEYEWTNTTAQVRYETSVTEQATGSLQASMSHYQSTTESEVGAVQGSLLQAGNGRAPRTVQRAAYGQEGANEITELSLKGRLNVPFSGRRGGVILTSEATYQGSRFRIGNAFASRLRHQAGTIRWTTAAEATVGLGPHTALEGGVRLTALPSQKQLFAEPRGALRYDRAVEGLGTVSVRIGGGLYRQFTTQFELNRDGATAVVPTTHVWLPVPSSVTPSRTYHLSGTLTWQPSAAWTIDVEGYRKWQPHLLAVDYPALRTAPVEAVGAPGPARFLDSSHGYAYGGGLHATYDGSSLTGSVRYAYSRARRTFPGRFDERLTPVPWTEPHRLTLQASVPMGGGVAVEAKGKGVWGRRWGYRRAYYAYLTPPDLGEAWDEIRLDRPGTHVLPPLYRLDTGVTIAQSWAGVDVKGRVGIVNLLDRDNVADWALQPKNGGGVTRWARSLPGRRTVVSIQVRY